MTTRTPARIKPNWKMPEAPLCCGQPMVPKAHNECGEWMIYFRCLCCEDHNDDGFIAELAWPFQEDWVRDADFVSAGFEIED